MFGFKRHKRNTVDINIVIAEVYRFIKNNKSMHSAVLDIKVIKDDDTFKIYIYSPKPELIIGVRGNRVAAMSTQLRNFLQANVYIEAIFKLWEP